MTKFLFFDTGPIITLVMARLNDLLPKLKEKYGGKFYITPAVEKELITRPMSIRRFEFEALQAQKFIRDGVLEVYNKVPQSNVKELIELANSSFRIKNKTIDVIQSGEIESVACALDTNADAIVMDERTLRLFIENNKEMKKLLESRFNQPIDIDAKKMDEFSRRLSGVKIIRSIELVSVAYKMGLLNSYIPPQKNGKEILVGSVLWATKYNGAAVTEQEVGEIKEYLLANKA
ncbi:MAG: hypothetical protein AB1668_02655 [Nanoarchaeota archaeon]